MPLQLSKPPPSAYDLIAQSISRLSMAEGASSQVTQVDDPSKLNCALQHKVYTLGSSAIVQGRNLNAARLVAWRFLIQYGSKTVAAIELSCDIVGNNLRFASLDTGPFGPWTRDAITQAEGLDRIKNGSYELRVLKAASVYVMALWLKNLDGGDDIVIPINPGQAKVGALATGGGAPLPQSANDFMRGLRSSAKASLDFDSTPKPGNVEVRRGLPRWRRS